MKLAMYLAGSLVFVMGGIWGVKQGQPILWVPIVFFGLCSLVFLVQLHPESSSLTLTPEKFVVRSLFRSYEHTWDEVDHFFPKNIASNKTVAFSYAPEYTGQQQARKISSKIAGAEAALPDTFGMKPDELASMLNAWKQGNQPPRL